VVVFDPVALASVRPDPDFANLQSDRVFDWFS